MSHLDTSLAELVKELPGATAVMKRYALSVCRGGSASLGQAIDNVGQSESAVDDKPSAPVHGVAHCCGSCAG